ncbi:Sec-independent protein translocase subunit TatA [Microbacterium sp.]|uniref:Sec-independent protein translocase subunit TatA n=1 Tax=Microbacterium sp. TaxID=51671 RepID=UPI002810DB62|nr:Sec-independent protein translocase subunit TatA [Microbacterium sp.]
MFGNLNGWHLVILLVVILLLFGAAKLPALAKSMGQSARVFKGEMKAMREEDASADASKTDDQAATQASTSETPSPSSDRPSS